MASRVPRLVVRPAFLLQRAVDRLVENERRWSGGDPHDARRNVGRGERLGRRLWFPVFGLSRGGGTCSPIHIHTTWIEDTSPDTVGLAFRGKRLG